MKGGGLSVERVWRAASPVLAVALLPAVVARRVISVEN